ncbi:small subunit ribosomal protein S4 [Sporobacter termitidis DSM 10068]|uniref:Small ribosomal subunit protein uS4 n=1 Tax=Sporobacter termitidis DSM 10068 TaxID=1123282 RepID=A0A1M5V8S5_9FIRM|nr:30S ribosomal protein S4 [Sporobacter termitidis]SHH71625.1 small subunit ribosomal protein S4 [Sporobacter termitidis DSM 10068]
MARYTDAVCRLCRREGQKLFLKGDRCYTEKCAVDRRQYAPGQHGQGRAKTSEYGTQLREKQKAKRYYGVLESQFRNYFDMAIKMKGKTGENLLSLLERRLDNTVYRLGFAMSRAEARQLVLHGHFTVDGRKVNIPSFIVKPGMVIALRDQSRSLDKFKSVIEANSFRQPPKWLDYNASLLAAKVLENPTREEIDLPVQEQLIVELYSK